MKSGSLFRHVVRGSIHLPVTKLIIARSSFLIIRCTSNSRVRWLLWVSPLFRRHEIRNKESVSIIIFRISSWITSCSPCLRAHSSALLFEAIPIFFAKAITKANLSSRIIPPIPAIPGLFCEAPSMFNLYQIGGGGTHLTSIKSLRFLSSFGMIWNKFFWCQMTSWLTGLFWKSFSFRALQMS